MPEVRSTKENESFELLQQRFERDGYYSLTKEERTEWQRLRGMSAPEIIQEESEEEPELE